MQRRRTLLVCVRLAIAMVWLTGSPAAGIPTFSIDPASPSIDGTVVTPDDLLSVGPVEALAGSAFGLSDAFPTGNYDDLDALSFGNGKIADDLQFSVDRLSIGLTGTPVRGQATGSEQAGDIYVNLPLGTHALLTDEAGFGLVPGFFGDDLDAFGRGDVNGSIYFSLGASSPSGAAHDVFLASGATFGVFAAAATLGLVAGDDVDALIVIDTVNPGQLDPGQDMALFSLAPSSTTVTSGGFSAADVLLTDFTGSFTLYLSSFDLGLRTQDNVNALSLVPEPRIALLLAMAGAAGLIARRRRGRAALPLACLSLAGLMGAPCSPTPTLTATTPASEGLLVTEVRFFPAAGDPEFVELQNVTAEPRDLDRVWHEDASAGTLDDVTLEANGLEGTSFDVGAFEPGDHLYAGRNDAVFESIDVALGDASNANPSVLSADYWDGSAWSALALYDGTDSAGATLGTNGVITFTAPLDWETTEVGDTTAFYVRLQVSSALSPSVEIDALDYREGEDLDFAGLEISNLAGDTYTVPSSLPPVPPEGIVLVLYDGLGPSANDEDFTGDDLAILHTGATLAGDVFDDEDDEAGVYTGFPHDDATRADRISWGPGQGTFDAHYNLPREPNSGFPIAPGESVGRETTLAESVGSLARFAIDEVSAGLSNLLNRPRWFSPGSGSSTSLRRPVLSWRGSGFFIKNWDLQCDDDADFSSPILTQTLDAAQFTPTADLPLGVVHCRVRTRDFRGRVSSYTMAQFTVVAPPPGGGTTSDLGVAVTQQRRDTNMVCLLDRGAPFSPQGAKGAHAWDAPHPARGDAHDDQYCCRAAIQMVAQYYGATNITQDRISYECYQGSTTRTTADPAVNDDLRHGVGMWPTCAASSDAMLPAAQQRNLIEWALNLNAGTVTGIQNAGAAALNSACPDCAAGPKPTFAQVQGWIDAGRPLIWVTNNPFHCHVIDGYTDPDGTPGNADDLIHVLDPWPGQENQRSFQNFNYGARAAVFVPPVGGAGRNDESSVSADPDADGLPRFVGGRYEGRDFNAVGLVSFDETRRFSTDANDPDSDDDCVQDKVEIWSYVHGAGTAGLSRIADTDADAVRAELDPDSDGGGTGDGREDLNGDGDRDRLLTGETDPMNALDDGALVVATAFQGTSPPVPGFGGTTRSWATMTLRADRMLFRWSSADATLGEIDTRRFVAATSWTDLGGTPRRVLFEGAHDGAAFAGDVLLGGPNQGVVDVTRAGGTVRYLLQEGCPAP